MQHILLQCVFAREVWFHTLSLIGLQCLTPGTAESSFQDWWHRSGTKIQKAQKKGFNSVVILVAWWLWKHRNSCVFDGATPDISKITQDIRDDAKMWCLARLAACRAERFVALTHGEFRPGRLLYSHLCNILDARQARRNVCASIQPWPSQAPRESSPERTPPSPSEICLDRPRGHLNCRPAIN